MILRISRRAISQYMMLYILVIMHGALIWSAVIGENYISLFMVAVLDVIMVYRYKIGLRAEFLVYAIMLFSCYFISAVVNGIGLSNGLNIKTAIIICLNIMTVNVILGIDKNNALSRFVKLVVFFASISLLFYILSLLAGTEAFPNALFPHLNWGRGHYGYLIYSYTTDIRNYGIFYEPGVYQVVLIAALYILIFEGETLALTNKFRTRAIIIIAITVITTGSTTGYISLGIIISGLIIKKNNKGKKKILLAFVILIILLIADFAKNGEASFYSQYVLEKFDELNFNGNAYQLYSSGGARMFIADEALRVLKTNPLFGLGATYIDNRIISVYGKGFGTGNALFTSIITKGLVTTLATLVPIFCKAFKNKNSNVQFIIFLGIYINTIFAQTQIAYGVLVLLSLVNLNNIKAENKKIIELSRSKSDDQGERV